MPHESVREMAEVESRYSVIPVLESWLHSFILSMLDHPTLSTTSELGQMPMAVDRKTTKLARVAPESLSCWDMSVNWPRVVGYHWDTLGS